MSDDDNKFFDRVKKAKQESNTPGLRGPGVLVGGHAPSNLILHPSVKQRQPFAERTVGERTVGEDRPKRGKGIESEGISGLLQNPALIGSILLFGSEYVKQMEGASDGFKELAKVISNATAKIFAMVAAFSAVRSITTSFNTKDLFKTSSSNNNGIKGFAENFLDNNRSNYAKYAMINKAKELRASGMKARDIKTNTSYINSGRMAQAGQISGAAVGILGSIVGDAISSQANKSIEEGGKSNTGAVIGGTLSGAGAGAALGTAILPGWGTAIGAGVGAIYGFTSSLTESSNKIKSVDITNSLEKFKYRLDKFNSGKYGVDSASASLTQELSKKSLEYDSSFNLENKQTIKASVNQNASGINELFIKIAKNSQVITKNKKGEDVVDVKKSMNLFDKNTKGTLDFFAKVTNVPYADLRKEIEKTISVHKIEVKNLELVNNALDLQSSRLEAFSTLITGLNTVEHKLSGFGNTIDTLSAFINSSSSSFKQSDNSEIFKSAQEGHVNLEQFSQITGGLVSGFGSAGKLLADSANESAKIIQALPQILIDTRKEDPLGSKENFSERLLKKLDGLGAYNDKQPSSTRNSIEAAIHDFVGNEGKEQPLLDKIRSNVKDVASQLSKDIGLSIEEMSKLSPAIKNHVDRIIKSFELYNQAQEKIADLALKRADKGFEVEDIINDVRGNGRNLPLSQLQSRESVKARGIGGSDDINVLADNLEKAQKTITMFDKKLSDNTLSVEESTLLLDARRQAELEANKASKALHFLAFEAKNLGNIQKQIAEEQKVALHAKSVAETLVFGGRDEKRDLSKTIYLSNVAKRDGIQNVPPGERRNIAAFMKEADPKGFEKVFADGLKNFGFDSKNIEHFVTGTNAKIDDLINQLSTAATDQQTAMNVISDNIGKQGATLRENLENANKTFLEGLKEVLLASELASKKRNLDNIQSNIAVEETKDMAGKNLKSMLGIKGPITPEVKGNIGRFQSELEKKNNLLTIKKNKEEEIKFAQKHQKVFTDKYEAENRDLNSESISIGSGLPKEYYTYEKKIKTLKEEILKGNKDLEEVERELDNIPYGNIRIGFKSLSLFAESIKRQLDILGNSLDEDIQKKLSTNRTKQNTILDDIYGKEFIGPIQKKAAGGLVHGSGVGDKVPALLSPKEFVIKASATNKIGVGTLNDINNGNISKFADGGSVGEDPAQTARYRRHAETMTKDAERKKWMEDNPIDTPTSKEQHLSNVMDRYGAGGTHANSKRFNQEFDMIKANKKRDSEEKLNDSTRQQKREVEKSSSDKNINTYSSMGDSVALRKQKDALYAKGMSIGKRSGGIRIKHYEGWKETNPEYIAAKKEELRVNAKAAQAKLDTKVYGKDVSKVREDEELKKRAKINNQKIATKKLFQDKKNNSSKPESINEENNNKSFDVESDKIKKQQHLTNIANMYGAGGTHADPKRFNQELEIIKANKKKDSEEKLFDSTRQQKREVQKASSDKNIGVYASMGDSAALRKQKNESVARGMAIGKPSGGIKIKNYEGWKETDPEYIAKKQEELKINANASRNRMATRAVETESKPISTKDIKLEFKAENIAKKKEDKRFEKTGIIRNKYGLVGEEIKDNREIFLAAQASKPNPKKDRANAIKAERAANIKSIEQQKKDFVNSKKKSDAPAIESNTSKPFNLDNKTPVQIAKENKQAKGTKELGINNNTNAGVNPDNIVKFNESIKTFSTTAKALTEALNNKSLEITMNGKVEVIINGGEIISKIQGQFKEEVGKQIMEAISTYHQKNWAIDGKEEQ